MNIKIKQYPDCVVHHLFKGSQPFHDDYGLWLCSYHRDGVSAARDVQPRYFEFYCISHMFKGKGIFWEAPDKYVRMKPGQCVIVAPRLVHHYGGWQDNYHEDTLCFAGSVADSLFRHGIIKTGVLEMGLARRLLSIIALAEEPAVNSQFHAALKLQELLLSLHEENLQQNQEKYPRLDRLLIEIRRNSGKWWTVEEMAEFCNLGTAQFRRVFRDHTGLLPKNYIDRLKVRKAIKMLTASEKPVEEVARILGYHDPFHFSKRFHQVTGVSPSACREQFLRSGVISSKTGMDDENQDDELDLR